MAWSWAQPGQDGEPIAKGVILPLRSEELFKCRLLEQGPFVGGCRRFPEK